MRILLHLVIMSILLVSGMNCSPTAPIDSIEKTINDQRPISVVSVTNGSINPIYQTSNGSMNDAIAENGYLKITTNNDTFYYSLSTYSGIQITNHMIYIYY